MKCVVLDDYQNAALASADWSSLADRVELVIVDRHIIDEDALVGVLAEADIVVVMRERTPIRDSLLSRLPRLKLIVTTGMQNSAIDLAAAAGRGVVVCGTGSGLTAPAELTWALILGLARHLEEESASIRSGERWQGTLGTDLAGATLGLIGLGRIGAQVARVGLAFGMNVIAWSAHLTAERAAEVGVRRADSLAELLAAGDFISIHLRLSDRSRNLIDQDALSLLKPTSFLINTARSAIIDQDALVLALAERRIAGAGLDVFDEEPLPAGHAFRTLDNVLATPHLGYVTQGNYRRYFSEAVEGILAFLDGDPIRVLNAG